MQYRGATSLTNGFSKKLENHGAAISLHIAHCNLCRWHETLRAAPARALGLTDRVWSIEKLFVKAADTDITRARAEGADDTPARNTLGAAWSLRGGRASDR